MFTNFSRFMNAGGIGQWQASPFGMVGGLFFGFFIVVAVAWTLYWKYHALWHAAKHDDKWWFVGLLVVNTLGILEILYLYYFSKKTSGHDEGKMPMVQ